jgi:acetoin utilization deacetylase AcuC-like enzyme
MRDGDGGVMATGFVFQELYLWHDTQNWGMAFPPGLTLQPGDHSEHPETKRRFRNLLDVAGLIEVMTPLKPQPASDDTLALVHTRAHIDRLRTLSAGYAADAGELTPMGRGSFEIAALAAGGTIRAMQAVLSGEVANAYALVRPPGHHALPDKAMGFCLFANIAVAIRHARLHHGLGRVAVVDWDVHHGNGTEAIFWDDPDTLTLSLHQDRLFPTVGGGIDAQGGPGSLGSVINVPLPPGSGNGAYLHAFERVVLPALRRFRPDLIVVASGFDASGCDPLGRMMVSADGFGHLAQMMVEAAADLCGGRLVLSHEGGYSAMYVPYCGLRVIERLTGQTTGIPDPWEGNIEAWGGQSLQPHQAEAIRLAAEAAGL